MSNKDMIGQEVVCYEAVGKISKLLDQIGGPHTQAHLLILLVEGLVCENTSSDVTFDRHGCGHGNASFHHDIVTYGQVAVWCKYSSNETDDRIAS